MKKGFQLEALFIFESGAYWLVFNISHAIFIYEYPILTILTFFHPRP